MNRSVLIGVAAISCVFLLILGCSNDPDSIETADLVMKNGKIVTVDDNFSIAEAVAVTGDTIVAVGTDEEIEKYIGVNTKILDLKGETVLPGINDAHAHPSFFATGRPPLTLDLTYSSVSSIAEIVQLVAEKISESEPGEWIRGRGWDENYLAELQADPSRQPNKEDLDAVSADNPVVLTHVSEHNVWVNSKALELAGITSETADPVGGHIVKDTVTGEPTGILLETAMSLVNDHVPPLTSEEIKEGLLATLAELNALGVTSLTDPLVDEALIDLYKEIYDEGKMSLRTTMLMGGAEYGKAPDLIGVEGAVEYIQSLVDYNNDFLNIAGIKLFADGIPPTQTAWMWDEYPGGGFGELITVGDTEEERIEQFMDMVAYINSQGLQIGIHAAGDRAGDVSVDAFIAALEDNAWDARHYLIHCDYIRQSTLDRMEEYDIGISTQTPIHYFAGDFLGTVMPVGSVHMPVKDMIDTGVHTANGSDAPVTYPNWKQGVETAVLREGLASGDVIGEEQRISIEEAIKMYTIEGAWQDHQDNVKGSIEVGKFADFCVLDEDILTDL